MARALVRVLFSGLVALPVACFSQDRLSAELVFPQFVRAIDHLETTSPDAAGALVSAQRDFAELTELLARAGAPPAYEEVFSQYARTLDALASMPPHEIPADRVKALAQDIQLKRDFIRSGFAFSSRKSKYLVSLRIRTQDGNGKEVHGLRVTGNPRGFADEDRPLFAFPKLTSPAVGEVLPGIYRIRLTLGKALIHSEDVSIGMTGNDTEELQFRIAKPAKK